MASTGAEHACFQELSQLHRIEPGPQTGLCDNLQKPTTFLQVEGAVAVAATVAVAAVIVVEVVAVIVGAGGEGDGEVVDGESRLFLGARILNESTYWNCWSLKIFHYFALRVFKRSQAWSAHSEIVEARSSPPEFLLDRRNQCRVLLIPAVSAAVYEFLSPPSSLATTPSHQ